MNPILSDAPESGDAFLRGVEAAHGIASPQQLFVWLRLHLHRFIPHDLALCWADAGREAGGPGVRVLNCVPLPDALTSGLANPTARIWHVLAERWAQGGERASLMPLDGLDDDLAVHLERAGFSQVMVHAVRLGPLQRADLVIAFLRQVPVDLVVADQALTALELWMPYLHFAFVRAEESALRRPAGRLQDGAARLLTARELQVLTAVRDAKANAQIGLLLGISPLTVKNHLRSIQKKLGAHNRAHAVAEAMSRRLIS
jgi:DNA-binding CsgD family transcriptional regulator